MKKIEKNITTIIGKDAVCDGGITAPGSVRIDGVVKGSVKVTGALVAGPDSVIEGDVEAASVLIGGVVNGNITAPEKTELTQTAKITGDITTGIIVIDEKAIFQGKCNMNIPEAEASVDAGEN